MRLPRIDDAVVGEGKIRDYLLSESHPVGRFKAAFFSSLGYSGDEWQALARALRLHAAENDAVPSERNGYGQKYEVRGESMGLRAKRPHWWQSGSSSRGKSSRAS